MYIPDKKCTFFYSSVGLTEESIASGENYIALYDFQAVEAGDLELHAGDRILVTETSGEWWKGTCNGRSGIFPANYVQKCPTVGASPDGGMSLLC